MKMELPFRKFWREGGTKLPPSFGEQACNPLLCSLLCPDEL